MIKTKKSKKIFALFICFTMIMSTMVSFGSPIEVQAASVVASGYSNDNSETGCPWTLDEEGTLTIGQDGQTYTLLKASATATTMPWHNNAEQIKKIQFKGTVNAGESQTYIFKGLTKLEEVNFDNYNFSTGKTYTSAFEGCSSLKSVDMSGKTLSSSGSYGSMFEECTSLETVNLAGLTFNGVVSYMFRDCQNIKSINLNNTKFLSSTNNMFYYACNRVEHLDLSTTTVSNSENMLYYFMGQSFTLGNNVTVTTSLTHSTNKLTTDKNNLSSAVNASTITFEPGKTYYRAIQISYSAPSSSGYSKVTNSYIAGSTISLADNEFKTMYPGYRCVEDGAVVSYSVGAGRYRKTYQFSFPLGPIPITAYTSNMTNSYNVGTQADLTGGTGINLGWYALNYKVHYIVDGEEVASRNDVTYKSTDITPKVQPKKVGYVLGTWYTDEEKTQPYTTGTKYSDLVDNDEVFNYNLYNSWIERNDYEVRYNTGDGGTAVSPKTGLRYFTDEDLASSETPTRPGYEFAGWYYLDPTNTNRKIEYDGQTYSEVLGGVDKDYATLYAKWRPKEFSVSYNTNGANEIEDRTVIFTDTNFIPRKNPTKLASTFVCWCTDSACENPYDPAKTYGEVVNNDDTVHLTLYAKWDECPHNRELIHETQKDPDCDDDGNYERYYCNDCKTCFRDGNKENTSKENLYAFDESVIPALGHEMFRNPGVAPTCTNAGIAPHWECERCNGYYKDWLGIESLDKENLPEEYVLPALGHDWNAFKTITEATCDSVGEKTHKCQRCDFVENADIPAKGHSYVFTKALWPDTNDEINEVPGEFVCENDSSHKLHVNMSVSNDIVQPTCETDGQAIQKATLQAVDSPTGKLCEDTKSKTIPKIGHDWKYADIEWTGNTAKAKYICQKDGGHVHYVDADVTETTTKPTCETKGETVYTAVVTADKYGNPDGVKRTSEKRSPIDELNHDWEFKNFEWTKTDDSYTAKAVYECKNDREHTKECNASVSADTTNADCETAGKIVYTATISENDSPDDITHKDTHTDKVNALGHKWKLDRFEWDGENATGHFVCENDNSHKKSIKATVTKNEEQSTCTGEGAISYTAVISAENSPSGKEETDTSGKIVDKKGHSWKFKDFSWQSQDDGYIVHANYVCENDTSHTESIQITLNKKSRAATCDENGVNTFIAKISKDDSLDNKEHTEIKEDVIEKTGHTWIKDDFEWLGTPDKYYFASIKYHCKNDASHELNVPATITEDVVPSTCMTQGEITYTATATDPNMSHVVVGTKTVHPPLLEHDYSFTEFEWIGSDENGYTEAKAVYHCSNGDHIEKVTVPVTIVNDDSSTTCEQGGKIEYSANISAEQSLDNNSHSAQKTINFDADGHNYQKIDKVESTCEDNGIDEHLICTKCHSVFNIDTYEKTTLEKLSLPKTEHDWDAPVVSKQGNCKEECEITYTCKNDSSHKKVVKGSKGTHVYGKWEKLNEKQHQRICKIDSSHKEILDHSWDSGKVITPATKTKDGSKKFTCTKCGYSKTEVLPKLNSSYSNIENVKGEANPKNSTFSPLFFKAVKSDKNSIKLAWNKTNANKYVLFGAKCGTYKYKKIKTTKNNSIIIKKVSNKKLKKGTYYKFILVSVDANDNIINISKAIHAATKGGKYYNYKNLTVKTKKNKKWKNTSNIKINKNSTIKLKAIPSKTNPKLTVLKHQKPMYESSNTAIAKINKNGVIKGVNKGRCKIYVYVQNGVYKTVQITIV